MRLFNLFNGVFQKSYAIPFPCPEQIERSSAKSDRVHLSELTKEKFVSYMYRTKNIICL